MMIKQGDRVKHTISNWTGTVMARRIDNAMVKWDHTQFTDKHKVRYLTRLGGTHNG